MAIYFVVSYLVSVAKLPCGGEATPPLRSGLRWPLRAAAVSERRLRQPLWRRLSHGVAGEHLHVVGALEGSGLRHRIAAHAALHLLDGIVLVLAHPHQQLGGDGSEERSEERR